MTERYKPPHSDPEVRRHPEYDADELTEKALEQLLRHREKIEHLLRELKEDIEVGRWGAILADDRSARLLGRVVHEVMRTYAGRHEQESPKLFFAAGDKEIYGRRNEDMRKYARHLKEASDGRMLILTNVTDSGNTIRRLGGALREAEVEHDTAILADMHEWRADADGVPERKYALLNELREENPGGKIYTASEAAVFEEKAEVRDILHSNYDPELVATGGVEKRTESDRAVTLRDERVPQKSINDIREAVKMLAEDMYQSVFGEPKTGPKKEAA